MTDVDLIRKTLDETDIWDECDRAVDRILNRCEWQRIETAPRNVRVLLLGTDIGVCVASNSDGDWGVVNDILASNPTHWMPLPKPPKDSK